MLGGLVGAGRALRSARHAANQEALEALTAGYRSLLDERAALTHDLVAELAAVKAELAEVRAENQRLVAEVAALRARLDEPRNEGAPR
ncbi:hypothetical protein GCM10012275_56420 [Longimycelium tulufanense]|uniref:Uncharacterized protein n=1 Tax=Longimycelium tulufanense TaxID=907463 RepID=A0A8J3CDP9_9PSEU|nr:hypothetical protein [Longimycelium tulufanense]GGM78498.1 hypothetical protein GCM10012275_56420 [Longimycelium tulufanense]